MAKDNSKSDLYQRTTDRIIDLAIGRILRMGSRASRPGDAEDYERCRAIIIDRAAPQQSDYQPNWARDRLKGAQGDAPC